MDDFFEELGIPRKYVKGTSKDNQFVALVHKLWLKSLVKHLKLVEFIDRNKVFESWPCSAEELGPSWLRIFVRVFKKRDVKVMPLPRIRHTIKDETPLFFCQLLQYISQTNYKNLWKEAFKKYSNTKCESSKETQVILEEYNDVLRETILRIYGCPIVNVCDPRLTSEAACSFSVNLNILPAVCCVETLNALFLIHLPYFEHNLKDCVTFSPAILDKCHTKPLFIVYQLLQTLKAMHDHSLTLGDVTLTDIYFTEDMWIYLFPTINSNIYVQETNVLNTEKKGLDCRKLGHKFDQFLRCEVCNFKTYDKLNTCSENLWELCQLWIDGQISNFTYISALNRLSGRKLHDPNCHYVFPWVTDFSSRCGKNWRDLKKSKYRLNKGDCQLDLTFESSQNQVPHHVSDVLSSITYYVYMARRTPKAVLCKNVRTNWVPAEYPSSIQRMQEWTPDECIPEFFTDSSVFRSIHEDLEDLELPPWCSSPEDFIEKHREALESLHVSEKLHHWIDLTFGYKLAGPAAVKAKNVCLNLVDGHGKLTKSGIVQLFTHPHPQKASSSVFWGKIPPKVCINKGSKSRSRDRSSSPAVNSEFKSDEEEITLSRFISRSRSSLNEEPSQSKAPKSGRSASLGPKNPTFTSHVKQAKPGLSVPSSNPQNGVIYLPREYKPELALELLEKKHTFFAKTFHLNDEKPVRSEPKKTSEVKENKAFIQNSFTNLFFSENFEEKLWNKHKLPESSVNKQSRIICNYGDIISTRRVRELQVLGCLIIEIFMAKQLRAFGANSASQTFAERLRSCLVIVKKCRSEIPRCVLHVAELLLQPETVNLDLFKYPVVTDRGLPPPSAHQFLEPFLNSIIPFPGHFPKLYSLISNLKEFKNVAQDLDILYHFDCNGELCQEYENLERTKILFAQNIGECEVKTCIQKIEQLFLDLNPTTHPEIVNILLPHIQELVENPPTAVLAAWYLFDPISRVLGPENTSKKLLEPILKLYENEPSEGSLPYNGKIAKLYHHSFLLRLIVRLGLKCFLENFIAPLVEAVGRYKDYEKVDFILHTHSEKHTRKTSHLKTMDAETTDVSASDDSSYSEKPKTNQPQAEPEMFEFDEEKPGFTQLQLNTSEDLNDRAEEALDATITENLDQLRSLEELKINLNEDENVKISSPTIPIPSFNKQTELLSNISCDVGSKKSEGSLFDCVLESPVYEILKKPRNQNVKISDMSADSLVWLSHRLGPVLTARFLSRNLLKMLTLCYVSKENQTGMVREEFGKETEVISVANSYVVGDQNAFKVLECLSNIAGLYGEQFILFQYIPHMSELIALCKRKLTPNLEGGLISCLALLQHVIPYLSDLTLMDHLQDVILKNILHPIVRLLGSTKYAFPSGSTSRNVLARKYIDVLYVLSIRMGSDMTRTHLAVPSLQRFFLIFDKVHAGNPTELSEDNTGQEKEPEESQYVEVCRDGTISEWSIGGQPLQISNLSGSQRSVSPSEDVFVQAVEELRQVFNSGLAHASYLPFLKQIGAASLEVSLKNNALIRELCQENESGAPRTHADFLNKSDNTITASSSIGSNISLIGNRIDVQHDPDNNLDLLSLVSNRMENNNRHLRGNWLAYWEHEIGRSDKDTMFNFKQIKLQTFAGHTHSVKCLHVLDNENSFMSGSRDKTVKLWSLRSQGDGQSVSNCQWTYTAHKKSVLSITFIESMRLVASCDSVVHIWDPFMGVNVGNLESARFPPVNVLRSLPAPSRLFLAATTEGSVKMVDARICSYIHELKVSLSPTGLIRCLAVAPSGLWCATGQSSGVITVLDCRTGLVMGQWRAHEGEVLQLVALDNGTLISTSLDQMISVWNANDGRFMFHLRGATEPVHCLNIYNNELISGTTANRIGVHTSIDLEASFSSTKLRSDAFKGLLTSMALLPLNRLLLLGADTGTINLLC